MKKNMIFALLLLVIGCKKFETNTDYKNTAFSFEITETSGVTADGKSAVKLVVIKTLKTEKSLKVVFTSSKGTLQATEMLFDGDTAFTYLTLDATPGQYLIKAQIKDDATVISEKTKIYTSVAPASNAFTLKLTDTEGATANGQSTIKLTLTRSISNDKKIEASFTTSNGTLLLTKVPFINNEAVTYLKLNRLPGIIYLTADVIDGADVKTVSNITYTANTAYPSSITLQSDRKFYNLKDPIKIETLLLDAGGQNNFSSGIKINFNVYQLSGSGGHVMVGNLQGALNLRTDDNGNVATLTFLPDEQMDKTKSLYIEGSFKNANGVTVTTNIKLDYKE